MTEAQQAALEASGHAICPECGGDGEITTFCGHEIEETCPACNGTGLKPRD